jgi:hypothetical protein
MHYFEAACVTSRRATAVTIVVKDRCAFDDNLSPVGADRAGQNIGLRHYS